MQDIRQWLELLDLGQYSTIFAENEIDVRDLPELSEEDLKDLGLPLGPRRRILAAVRDFGSDTPPDQAQSSHPAERRQIAVLFCDLVGSTALSAQLDPEDMRDLMQRYQDVVSAEIVRFGGFVAKFLGDGVLAYFGYPTAHEDSTERAIRAGLGIVGALRDSQAEVVGATGTSISSRVGIESGLVVVGDMIGETASESGAIVGETPNLASRLEGVASPGEIVIGPAARRLAGYAFLLEHRGPQILKGMTKPVRAWKVVGEAETEGRFEATRGPNLTPFVGRDAELSLLMEKWDDASAGEGRVVFVSGEAGIGKSRLTQVLRERLRKVPHTRLNYQCSPYHTSSALHPILRQFERAAGFASGDDPATRLAKLEATITPGPMVTETAAPLFAAMMGLAAGDRYPPLGMTPQKQKAETAKALADQVAALAETQPVLLIFEDAHWIDPTSQEVVEVLAARIAELRALLVVPHRPEYAPPPGMQAMGHVSSISLARLGRRQSAELAAHVSGGGELSDETLTEIVTRTDGIPLFLEELSKSVAETGLENVTTIPATLQDSLMVRLDRLSPVRETAQIASCIGREFDTGLLTAISPLGENALSEALQELINAQLIFRSGKGFSFKHALVQSAAYESLLKSRRQELHGRIAQSLEDKFSEAVQPEIIAQHFDDAGDIDKAKTWWLLAGQSSLRNFAFSEARAHLENGLIVLQQIEESDERDRQELDFHSLIAIICFTTKGFASEETEDAFLRCLELCRKLESTSQEFQTLFGLSVVYWVLGEMAKCEETTVRLLSLAGQSGDDATTIMAQVIHGMSSLLDQGRFREAKLQMDGALGLFRPEHEQLVQRFGLEPSLFLNGYQAHCLWYLGYPDQAMASFERALECARRLKYPTGFGFMLTLGCMTALFCGEDRTDELLEEGYQYCIDQGLPDWEGMGLMLKGLAKVRTGKPQEGMQEIVAGEEIRRSIRYTMTWAHAIIEEGALACDDPETALEYAQRAIDRSSQTLEGRSIAEHHRLKGLALLAKGDADGAEASILSAINVAREQSAKSWELRAATSLARLWCDQGRRDEARSLLAPVYGWFTEGFGTPDLKAAKVLLDEMSSMD